MGNRHGRAGLLVLVALTAALAVAVALWAPGGGPSADVEGVRPGIADAPARVDPAGPPAPARVLSPSPSDGERVRTPEPDLTLTSVSGRSRGDGSRFLGRGTLRGYVETGAELPFPERWELVIEPSTTLFGRERAESRVVEFRGGEQRFEVEGLPLAGYDVHARAAGMTGLRQPVLLDRHNPSPFVVLRISTAGFLEGRLVDEAGAPLADVPVALESPGGAVLQTASDAIGRYRFDGVEDGEYKLVVGHRSSPILPAEWLHFRAPSMTLPERTLAGLGRIEILVLDDGSNLPVEGATVRGSGSNGGHVELVTDRNGVATALFLPAGLYRLSARHERYGRTRGTIEVAPGDAERLTLRIRSR